MSTFKRMIRWVINASGYDICKISDKEKCPLELYYKIYGKDAVLKRRFYNIGAGNFWHPPWTNIDCPNDWYKEDQGDNIGIKLDLLSLSPIPVETNSAEIVYSSHTIEHISDEAAENMLKESYRILKKGAFFRITMPNIDLDFRAYKDNDRDYFSYVFSEYDQNVHLRIKPLSEISIQQMFLWRFSTNASTNHADGAPERISDEELDNIFHKMEYEEALTYCIAKTSLKVQKKYPGDHINYWNKNKIFRMLKIVGFNNIFLSGYGQSFCPVLRNTLIFDNTAPKVSLYVEAIK